ncbi:TIGR03571 family LLM class oxidoreductase [Haloglomus litoreum]|uniref:TIGR03571 family LLM class oxidoreductase n=1 Tax=Haloglomus litoreum TaxID=3034026 RepID=UPI0023E85D63|nr:TIGR03571 family LLM class oxidoreductase [Haloglomus sp. DT116]
MTECDADHRNAGFERLFGDDGLTVGTGFPLTDSRQSRPPVERELELAAHAEAVGFDALWARDVPFRWPRFRDTGQTYDTFPWLSHVAAHTDEVALGTASVVLPIRHPAHVAKAAASVDRLSDGRLVLGVATGDRDPEYDAFDVDPEERGARFRESVATMRALWRGEFPEREGWWGELDGELDLVPKPTTGTLPLLPTGHCRQTVEWLGANGDGWLFYHLPEDTLASYLDDWHAAAAEKPFAMALQAKLADDPTADPEHVHQGFRAGAEWFVEYFARLETVGVDHVLVGVGADGESDPERALTRFAEAVIEQV